MAREVDILRYIQSVLVTSLFDFTLLDADGETKNLGHTPVHFAVLG